MAPPSTVCGASASSSASSFKDTPAPSRLDVDSLDDEEKKVLDEVQKKGYYHGRPRNAPGPAPKRLDVIPESLAAPGKVSCQAGGSVLADAVEWVMNARDQYALLGATASASQVELRHCYLRLATELHPLVGADDDSRRTDAFCRTAAAWAELGDPGARWRYDMELHAGRGLLALANEENQVHKPPPMDLEKAHGVFVFETWVCSSSMKVPFEFSETLRRAQQLVEEQEMRDRSSTQVPAQSVAGSFAMSAGLLAVGCAATAAGYPAAGALARNGAICQAAAGGISAYQHSDGVAESLRPSVERVRRSVEDCGQDPLAALIGIGGLSCLQRPREHPADEARADSETSASEEEAWCDEEQAVDSRVILLGDTVRLCGLQESAGFNGRLAHVVTVPSGKGLFRVQLLPAAVTLRSVLDSKSASPPRQLMVQKANLQLANEGFSSESRSAIQRMDDAPTSGKQFL